MIFLTCRFEPPTADQHAARARWSHTVKITDDRQEAARWHAPPIHPGEIFADELDAIELSAAEPARLVGVPANRISQIVAGRRNVTADTAFRLGRYFGTSADFWMNLQKTYELDLTRAEIGPALEHIPQRPTIETAPDACGPRPAG